MQQKHLGEREYFLRHHKTVLVCCGSWTLPLSSVKQQKHFKVWPYSSFSCQCSSDHLYERPAFTCSCFKPHMNRRLCLCFSVFVFVTLFWRECSYWFTDGWSSTGVTSSSSTERGASGGRVQPGHHNEPKANRGVTDVAARSPSHSCGVPNPWLPPGPDVTVEVAWRADKQFCGRDLFF